VNHPVSIRRLHTTFIKLPYLGALIGRGKPIRPYRWRLVGLPILICEADIDLVVAKEMELMIKVVEIDLQLPALCSLPRWGFPYASLAAVELRWRVDHSWSPIIIIRASISGYFYVWVFGTYSSGTLGMAPRLEMSPATSPWNMTVTSPASPQHLYFGCRDKSVLKIRTKSCACVGMANSTQQHEVSTSSPSSTTAEVPFLGAHKR
jgi:hypothetical protein